VRTVPPDADRRPDPDQLLRRIQADESCQRIGKLKVFLGYASGVGKSFRMLEEGRRRKERGEDVVIGALQRKMDAPLEKLLPGFETVPPLSFDGGEAMDLRAILERKPRVCLIDGLAHDNPPRCRNSRRYQDVQQLRDAGISVITAINLQHIEELRSIVEPLTGKGVAETVPKAFLTGADEIEIVDMSPEQLIERLGQQPDQAARAVERRRLSELREIALFLAAEVVDRQLEDYIEAHGLAPVANTQERILVCVTPRANATAMLAVAQRTAERFHGELHVLNVRRADFSEPDREAMEKQFGLAREAGARVEVRTAEHPVEVIVEFARQNRITQIFVGHSFRKGFWSRVLGNPVDRLIRLAEGMDVCIFPH
jgi:two-component system, OmpR family, sensor histidine kinase KdpD